MPQRLEYVLFAAAYAVVSIYYITAVSKPTFSQQLHGSVSSLMILHNLAMSTTRISELINLYNICVLMGMQWVLYATFKNTPVSLPHWFLTCITWQIISKLLRATELRIFQLVSELQRVVPSWEYEFLYCHAAAPRLILTDAEARSDNEIICDLADMRMRGETPDGLTSKDWALWYKTDHRSIFISRCQRRTMLSTVALVTMTLYAWWWYHLTDITPRFGGHPAVRWAQWWDTGMSDWTAQTAAAIDLCMVASLFTECTTLQLLVYHVVFLSATGWLALTAHHDLTDLHDLTVSPMKT
jgi:hypothetical protein